MERGEPETSAASQSAGSTPRRIPSAMRMTLVLGVPFAAAYIAFVVFIALWDINRRNENHERMLLESARAYHRQVLIARSWNARHGGVYAAVSDKLAPNPYLQDPERDITSTAGKRYTKINPAFMTRLIAEIANTSGAYTFNLTSSRPLNPDNRPDEWESASIRDFEARAAQERYAVMNLGGSRHFRYIAPLYTTEECLPCHAKYGYRVGDVRGALTVNLPTRAHDAMMAEEERQGLVQLGAVAMAPLLFVIFIIWRFSRKLADSVQKEIEAEKLRTAMQMAGAAAHELRQPMTALLCTMDIIKHKTASGEPTDEECEAVHQLCMRMNGIIRRMQDLTRLRTKPYIDGIDIVDLEKSSDSVKDDTPR